VGFPLDSMAKSGTLSFAAAAWKADTQLSLADQQPAYQTGNNCKESARAGVALGPQQVSAGAQQAMTDQSIEGLRKAARRVFWEAKNIETASKQAVREALLGLADRLNEEADDCEDGALEAIAKSFGFSSLASKVSNPAYVNGYVDALRYFATGIRVDLDEQERK
jgi:hypothetical protein